VNKIKRTVNCRTLVGLSVGTVSSVDIVDAWMQHATEWFLSGNARRVLGLS
jgi:hypothetical protein